MFFSTIFTKGNNFCDCLHSWTTWPFQNGSTLKGKNLLLEEQILFYKSIPIWRREAKMKMAELLPLKVNPVTFNPIDTSNATLVIISHL